MWSAVRFTGRDVAWVALPVAVLAALVQVLPPPFTVIAWLALFAWMIGAPLIARRHRLERDAAAGAVEATTVPRARRVWVEVLLALPLTLACLGLEMAVMAAARAVGADTHTRLAEAVERAGGGTRAVVVLFVFGVAGVSFGPIAEEIFFRGFLMSALARRTRIVVAWLVQALAFALYHGGGAVETLGLGVAGLALGAVVWWRGRLLTAIVTHALFNGVVIAVALAAVLRPLAHLGVSCEPSARACTVRAASADEPAGAAGVRVGDVIVAVDGYAVTSSTALGDYVRAHARVGEPVTLTLERDGVRRQIVVVPDRLFTD